MDLDLICHEVDFEVKDQEEKKREARYTAEIKIFFTIRLSRYIKSKRYFTRV